MIVEYEPEPSISKGQLEYIEMVESPGGGYLKTSEVIEWLKEQRNDIPMTGEEAANGLKYALGLIR